MNTVLYIDDEQNNLIGFRANFRFNFHIYTASNTSEAELLLYENPNIEVILCDQNMPRESGIEFFFRIKDLFPKPTRILITAFAEPSIVIEAINKGNIFRFLRKPWAREDILSAIQGATTFYKANSMLELKNHQLQLAYEELDKFAYTVSHDLRDPLLSVHTAIKIGLGINDIGRIYDLLFLMNTSLISLEAYINNLSEYYLLRRGELLLSKIDFNAIMKNIRKFYEISIQNQKLSFEVTVEQNGEFWSDKTVLELVIHNLLSNAFKYQKKDSTQQIIRIFIRSSNKEASIMVNDNGIGIAEENFENLFSLFYRASNQSKGSGLGLFNVQQALLKLKGTIKVESKINIGTTFTVHIPGKRVQ